MRKIGFVTSEVDPELIADDRLAIPFLNQYGFSVDPVVWDSPSIQIADFDLLIFRSCWNYHRKYPEFLTFLDRVKKSQVPVYNPIETIQWNLNKKHILEFDGKIAVPRTKWIENRRFFAEDVLEKTLSEWNVNQLVVKPAVSLSGHDTYLIDRLDFAKINLIIRELLKERDVLIQEYIPEIKTEGEISLIFFNRAFSHAIRKVPAKNEFRIHQEYGGERFPIEASTESISYGKKLLEHVSGKLLYARVDIVETKSGPVLIELEVTDPMLFLGNSDLAAKRFADAIVELRI